VENEMGNAGEAADLSRREHDLKDLSVVSVEDALLGRDAEVGLLVENVAELLRLTALLHQAVLEDRLVDEPGVVQRRRGPVAHGEALPRVDVGVECGEAEHALTEHVLVLVEEHGGVGHGVGQVFVVLRHVLYLGQLALADQAELDGGAVVASHDDGLLVAAHVRRLEDDLEREHAALGHLEDGGLDLEGVEGEVVGRGDVGLEGGAGPGGLG